MPNKQFTVMALSLVFAMKSVSGFAKEVTLTADSTTRYSKTISTNKPNQLKRLDAIKLSASERELASSSIENILNDSQFSNLRRELKENQHEYVQAYLNKYTSRAYQQHFAKMKGLAAYYFPIFERVFKETNIPEEIKYLAVIESALNPHAVSRVGATGPWQFMYATAKGYGLEINSYVDERKDPVEATYAASKYLKDAFEKYGDWFLAIASYNCGQGNVNKAIRRSGIANPSFWEIAPYLPRETRNYVPAFIAIAQVFENENHHQSGVVDGNFPVEIDIVQVDKALSFDSVADVLGISEDDLNRLNPAYKRGLINGSKSKPGRLIVPKIEKAQYAGLYNLLQNSTSPAERIIEPAASSTRPSSIAYRVKKGDTLDGITKKFKGSSISDLKAENGLKNNVIHPGMTLKISQN